MSYNFLIVDHSATGRAFIKRSIRLAGLSGGSMLEAADEQEALEVLQSARVDLVVADLRGGEGSDVEAIGRILAEPATRSVPVMIVSAHSDPRQIDQLRRRGAREHLREPFTPQALRDAVCRILEPTHVL